MARVPFPFTAIVGQDDLKLALTLCAVDPGIGGVLAFGDRGTGKSTAVRALAALLPPMMVLQGCRYGCDPSASPTLWCQDCASRLAAAKLPAPRAGGKVPAKRSSKALLSTLPTATAPVPVVDLPLGASEDRIVGALDLERALAHGEKTFEPGLLARAHRGFLYIDEVNLLEDHLVDLLIDVAASGENVVEREGLSVRHPARFVLIGSGNPEEGELRPQLLDRFGLAVDVKTPTDIPTRVTIVKRRDAYEHDTEAFHAAWAAAQAQAQHDLVKARARLSGVKVPDSLLEQAATLCAQLGTDGLRGEITLVRASRALAALDGAAVVTAAHLARLAVSALRHRLRRNPLDDTDAAVRVSRTVSAFFGAARA
jgi:magnesium chelatase subunit I